MNRPPQPVQTSPTTTSAAVGGAAAGYRWLFDNAPDMYHILALDGAIKEVNQKPTELLGYTKGELMGSGLSCIVADGFLPELQEALRKVGTTGLVANSEGWLKRKDGSLLPVAVMVRRLDGPHGQPQEMLCVMRDLTQHKAAAEEMACLRRQGEATAKQLFLSVKSQEEEREWVALEVHDRVAQNLASVFQQLQSLESLTQPSPELHGRVVRASFLCKEAIREARNIMNDLRPAGLDELGLLPLVEDELRQLKEEKNCRVESQFSFNLRPPREVEVALYRIVHEAFTNIRRHAAASVVSVRLASVEGGVHCSIQDNGAGFDVAGALAGKRVGGLVSMQRRAELAGGTCLLESEPGSGTKVSVSVPIP